MLTKIKIISITKYNFHWLLINDLSKRVVALMEAIANLRIS